jgi:hypothetical protein
MSRPGDIWQDTDRKDHVVRRGTGTSGRADGGNGTSGNGTSGNGTSGNGTSGTGEALTLPKSHDFTNAAVSGTVGRAGTVRLAPSGPGPHEDWRHQFAPSGPAVLDLRLPPTEAPDLPPPSELERLADSYAILSLDARRQVVELFRPALDRLGAVPNGRLADLRPGRARIGGLVVTRQHPMTARGTVFLALEDETGMVNVTLWPDRWARFRGVVRRHALLWVDGELQREANVVNVVASDVRPLPDVARAVGGPQRVNGVTAQGYAGMRRG